MSLNFKGPFRLMSLVGSRMAAGAGGSSTMTWALVPLIPNEEMPARRGRPFASQGRASLRCMAIAASTGGPAALYTSAAALPDGGLALAWYGRFLDFGRGGPRNRGFNPGNRSG